MQAVTPLQTATMRNTSLGEQPTGYLLEGEYASDANFEFKPTKLDGRNIGSRNGSILASNAVSGQSK